MDHPHSSINSHQRAQRSATLNRHYVKRPEPSKEPQKITSNRSPITIQVQHKTTSNTIDIPPQIHPYQKKITDKKQSIRQPNPQLTAKERKDQAIEQALRSVKTTSSTPQSKAKHSTKKQYNDSTLLKNAKQSSSNAKRIVVALACALGCVAVLVTIVSLNMPDISVRVAAIQTGIEASYPSYVPRDYTLANIISEEGKVTMEFTGPDNSSFTLVEEKSSWDSTALLNNYIKNNWNSDYSVTHEQGITLYLSDSGAAWVNGGILFTITPSGAPLTKKQLRNIATSL